MFSCAGLAQEPAAVGVCFSTREAAEAKAVARGRVGVFVNVCTGAPAPHVNQPRPQESKSALFMHSALQKPSATTRMCLVLQLAVSS